MDDNPTYPSLLQLTLMSSRSYYLVITLTVKRDWGTETELSECGPIRSAIAPAP